MIPGGTLGIAPPPAAYAALRYQAASAPQVRGLRVLRVLRVLHGSAKAKNRFLKGSHEGSFWVLGFRKVGVSGFWPFEKVGVCGFPPPASLGGDVSSLDM